ncbi:MAG: hypothetical protein ACE5IR_00940 [bacterium]
MANLIGKDLEKIIIEVGAIASGVAFSAGIFLSIFATANLVPRFLEKGAIELILSKPLSRPLIFISRFLGAQSIVAFNVTYLIAGTWLVLSIKTGIWYWPFLYSVPMVMIAFAIIYALMAFVGVTTRSTGVTIMVAYLVLFFSPFLVQKDRIYALLSNKSYDYILEGLYHVMPKIHELSLINHSLVKNLPVEDWSALWTSSLAGMFVLFFAVIIFSKKNF